MNGKRVGCVVAGVVLLLSAAVAQSPAELTKRAAELFEKRQYDEALALMDRVVAADGATGEQQMLRARVLSRLERFEEAIAGATRAVELDPSLGQAWFERAYCRARLGQREQAVADYDRAAELLPDHPRVYGERGDLLMELGRLPEAIRSFSRAIELEPRWPSPVGQRAEALRRLADFEAAELDFRRLTELQPDVAFGWFGLSGTQFDRRQDEAALKSAQRMVRVFREYSTLVLRGKLAWRIGDIDTALADLGRAAKGDDAVAAAEAMLVTGCVQLGRGEAAAAAEVLERAAAEPAMFTPWIMLMRWCAEAPRDGLESAGAKLRERWSAIGVEDEMVQALVELCASGAGDDGSGADYRGRGMEACPRLFFAAWRARCEGRDAQADELLRRCLCTGRKDWLQWVVAESLLRARHDGAALTSSLGMHGEAVEVDDGRGLRITALDEGGAAWSQGLEVGDVIVAVSDKPFEPDGWLASLAALRVGHDLHLTWRRGDEQLARLVRTGVAR